MRPCRMRWLSNTTRVAAGHSNSRLKTRIAQQQREFPIGRVKCLSPIERKAQRRNGTIVVMHAGDGAIARELYQRPLALKNASLDRY